MLLSQYYFIDLVPHYMWRWRCWGYGVAPLCKFCCCLGCMVCKLYFTIWVFSYL